MMDHFLVRWLLIPLVLGARQILNYLFEMTEKIHPQSTSSTTIDIVSNCASNIPPPPPVQPQLQPVA
jgi:hypothetical protein